MKHLPPRSGGVNPFKAALYGIGGLTLAAVGVTLGLLLFGALMAVALVAAVVAGARIWWVTRSLQKPNSPLGRDRPPRPDGRDDLTADYEVVERRQR